LFGSTGTIILFLGGGILLPLLASLVHCELHHLLATIIQYYAMLGTFVITLNIYAFSNVHDLSWGTKGAETAVSHQMGGKAAVTLEQKKKEEAAKKAAAKEASDTADAFQIFRSTLLIVWISANMIVIMAVKSADPMGDYFMLYLVSFVSVINFFRFVGSMIFITMHYASSIWGMICSATTARKSDDGIDRSRKESRREHNKPTPKHIEMNPLETNPLGEAPPSASKLVTHVSHTL
jgi:hypothetical protein